MLVGGIRREKSRFLVILFLPFLLLTFWSRGLEVLVYHSWSRSIEDFSVIIGYFLCCDIWMYAEQKISLSSITDFREICTVLHSVHLEQCSKLHSPIITLFVRQRNAICSNLRLSF